MLKVASFEITDSAGMNLLLTTKKLADGMHILVSEGNALTSTQRTPHPIFSWSSEKMPRTCKGHGYHG